MSNELKEIRAALEHQIALYGDLVIVSGEEARPTRSPQPTEALQPALAPQSTEAPELENRPSPEAPSPEPDSEPQTHVPTEPDPTPQSEGPHSEDPQPEGDVYHRIAELIPQDSPLRKMGRLEEVQSWVAATELIELDTTRIKPVFGVGNPQADLMVIGEAPGADEDKQGEPFVGRAGKLLTQILEAIGFERSDVYIANILKSRPPDNRKPKPEEVKAHLPILHKQIALIQPKLILCVGRTSGTSLLGMDSSLKDMRGIFHDYHGIPVMVTYHPAALLRNPNWKRPTWDDVQQLRERYDQLTA